MLLILFSLRRLRLARSSVNRNCFAFTLQSADTYSDKTRKNTTYLQFDNFCFNTRIYTAWILCIFANLSIVRALHFVSTFEWNMQISIPDSSYLSLSPTLSLSLCVCACLCVWLIDANADTNAQKCITTPIWLISTVNKTCTLFCRN